MFRIASSQASCSKTKPAFLLNFCIAQRYDSFCTQTRHISQLKITDVIFPSCKLFYLHFYSHLKSALSTFVVDIYDFRATILLGCFYNWNVTGRKMENGINKNTRTRVLLFIPFFISLPRTHSNYRNNQARWRLGNAEMPIVVTTNDGKKKNSRLGKITSVDFNYKTYLVRVPNASYRCAV